MIDLGDVHYTTEVFINDIYVGHTIWSPHQLEITSYIKNGVNSIKVLVQPTKRNAYVKKALDGKNFYTPFKRKEQPMPAGLYGPVNILKI